ncbi:MAG: GAF domain-containing sensor histidine kinase [Pseudomonadota bacterium]
MKLRYSDDMAVKSYETLFRLAKSLNLYPDIDSLLDFITREILNLINVEGAMVLLLDVPKDEFYFSAATFEDGITGKKIKAIRFPSSKGVAGQVLRTGQPLIVSDTTRNYWFFGEIDRQTGYQTRNMLDVPIRVHSRIIGVLCAVNKKGGEFDAQDMELLLAIADTVAHPIENTRINQELARSYEEVKSLSSAKDKVIHHLSHELKTPVSVLSASLDLIEKKLGGPFPEDVERIFVRARRNLQRLLEMQYEIEDLLQKKDYKTFYLLSKLLDSCVDELEVLITEEMGGLEVLRKIDRRIEELFGPRESVPRSVDLQAFVEKALRKIGFRFAHRECRIIKTLNPVPLIMIPEDVLMKILEGLVRNAVENTPDRGEVEVYVKTEKSGVLLEVEDHGVGITPENLNLLFENYFTVYDTSGYSSRNPYDFGAGGKGFDLLRMKLFSEQYHFQIRIHSRRCRFIIEGEYTCPGNIDKCSRCSSVNTCRESGGTVVSVFFPAPETMEETRGKQVP